MAWAAASLAQMCSKDVGFDVVIVCTTDASQEEYWQSRLQATRGAAASSSATIVVVNEGDWPGGAGNGLGSLFAFQNAVAKAKKLFNLDLNHALQSGSSVAIYHTAGKGTRMAPLPASETNNKPAVALCSLVEVGSEGVGELSILEAVIKQTGAYAPGRKGRCSVFWGDQVFVPSAGAVSSGSHHADILANLGPMPSDTEWRERGLEKYGLIAVRTSGDAVQVEKVTHEQAVALFGGADDVAKVGPSLGSFSVSATMLQLLVEEFDAELQAKKGKLDSDPHFWMPLTLSKESYLQVMATKSVSNDEAAAHFQRMSAFKDRLLAADGSKGVFGCIDVGDACYWWDYGQLQYFYKNSLLATAVSEEADALRTFLSIAENRVQKSEIAAGCVVSADSVVLNSRVAHGTGRIVHSTVSSVVCNEIDVEDCVLINVTARRIKAKGCVLYNVVEDSPEGLDLTPGSVRADVFRPSAPIVVRSRLDIDGGKAWYDKVEGNEFSFDEIHKLNQKISIQAAAKEMHERRTAVRSALSQ